MTGTSPGRAACEAYGEIWANQGSIRWSLWEDAARAAISSYIKANGRDPVDAASVITEAVVPELAGIREQLRAVYTERARLVAFLAACYPSVMLTDDAEPDWPIVFVDTPAGQLSWHVARADLGLFAHVPATAEPTWDGHTTEVKYERLADMTARLAEAGGVGGIAAAVATARPVTAATGENTPGAPEVTAQRVSEYYETVDDLRRELVEVVQQWRLIKDTHRIARYDENAPQVQRDAYLTGLMAGNYAYTLAAVLGVAQREFGNAVASRLTSVAAGILTNGDGSDLNADVVPQPEPEAADATPGEVARP